MVIVNRLSGVLPSTYLSGNRAGGDGPQSILDRLNASTADDPSPSVADVDLGSGTIAEFQRAVTDDIQMLYEKVEQQGVLSQMADAGTGEAIKIGASEIGELSGIPFGKLIGDLSGAALQAIYENRNKVLEFLGLKSESAVDEVRDPGKPLSVNQGANTHEWSHHRRD